MLTSLIIGLCLAQGTEHVPYNIETWKVNPGPEKTDKIIRIAHTATPGIGYGITKDNRVRWFRLDKPGESDPIKEVKLTDFPVTKYVGKQAEDVKKANEYLENVMGGADKHEMQGITMIPYDHHKQFVLTNGHEQFFFYSSEDGKLLRKLILQKGPEVGNYGVYFSPDGKYVMTGMVQTMTMYVHSMETGKKVSEFKRGIFDYYGWAADSKRILKMKQSKMSYISAATGKELTEGAFTLAQPSVGAMTMNPDFSGFSYSAYNSKGSYDGNYIYNFKDKKSIRIDKRADNVGPFEYSPDGKLLVLYESKWLYFVDARSGALKFVIEAAPHAMWDLLIFTRLDISEDGKTVLFVPDPAQNDLRHGVISYLDSKPLGPVKFFGPKRQG